MRLRSITVKQPGALAGIVCMLLLSWVPAARHKHPKGIVAIINVDKTTPPSPDVAHHKHHDVVVYRTLARGGSYEVYLYSNAGGPLFCYKVYWGLADDMDNAAYKWLNDTLVDIRLYSTHNAEEKRYRLQGNKQLMEIK